MAPSRRPPLILVPAILPAGNGGPLSPLGELFRAYSAYVAYIAVRILGQDDDVDDVVQDTFMEAARGLSSVREAGAIKGWLGTIAVRVASRKLKVRRLRRFLGLDEGRASVQQVFAGADGEQMAQLAHIYRLLDLMPARQRIAWILRTVEGETIEEVARLSDCSTATAKRWVKSVDQHIERNLGHA